MCWSACLNRHSVTVHFTDLTSQWYLVACPGKLIYHRGDVLWPPPPHTPLPGRRTIHLAIYFVVVPKRKMVRRQSTRYSSVAKCNWEGIARHTSPNVWAGDDRLLSEGERVREKQGSSFKRRYFSCLTIFLKYSYGILKLQNLLYLLKK